MHKTENCRAYCKRCAWHATPVTSRGDAVVAARRSTICGLSTAGGELREHGRRRGCRNRSWLRFRGLIISKTSDKSCRFPGPVAVASTILRHHITQRVQLQFTARSSVGKIRAALLQC